MSHPSENRLLINSMPKSGTHLLTRTAELLGWNYWNKIHGLWRSLISHYGFGLPASLAHEPVAANRAWLKARKDGGCDHPGAIPVGVVSPLSVPVPLITRWLDSVPPGCFVVGHVPYSPEMAQVLKELHYKHIWIIRHPLDVLVSFVRYVVKPHHQLKDEYADMSELQRFDAVIDGMDAIASGRTVLPFVQAYMSVARWVEDLDSLPVRFEQAIGARGGGNPVTQQEILEQIATYLDTTVDPGETQRIASEMFDEKSPTFRRGRIDTWKKELPKPCLDRLRQPLTEVVERLGYDFG